MAQKTRRDFRWGAVFVALVSGTLVSGTLVSGTLVSGTLVSGARAGEVEREVSSVATRIDAEIEGKLSEAKTAPAEVADDVEFLRRTYLDLTGSAPLAHQAAAFLDSEERDRAKLIDELLADDRFGLQFGRVWRDWIAPAELPSEGNGGNQPIKATRNLGSWFAEQFNEDRPWDEIVAAVLSVEGTLKEAPQGLFFSLSGTDTGIPEPAGAVRAVSSLFLGVDLQCAQCHDDPYREWKQDDFWGAAAFFKNMEGRFNGRYFDSITESFGKKLGKGGKKTTTRDKSPNGSITIPKNSFKNAGSVVEARYLLGEELEAEEKQPLRGFFSGWVVSKDNPYFARAFVNRTWAYFFSRGLVEPIDDMRPANTASHPETLELLTTEFVESGFDVKHLVRCIVTTKAYQRTSRGDDPERAVANLFGRRATKLMSADQLYDSLKFALDDPRLDVRTYDSKESKKFGESSPVGDEHTEFQRLFETDENDATVFTHGIPQFLALVNHPNVSSGGPAVAKLIKDKVEPTEAVERLYLGTLSRKPTEEELREAVEFVVTGDDRSESYAGVLWMLLNRSEFLLVR